MEQRSLQVLEDLELRVVIPLEVWGMDISLTNLALSMMGAVVLFILLFYFLAWRPQMVPGRKQVLVELFITFVKKHMVYNMMGKKEGKKWWPLIAGLFLFMLSNNLVGLVPGAYSPTANPVVPLTIAVLVFLGVQFLNFYRNRLKGFKLFLPAGVPPWMYVIVVPIEVLTTLTKPFSLFIRLFANMLAGHVIIYVLIGLAVYFRSYYVGIASIPLAAVMNLFELFVRIIQAYIFAVLSSMYIGEATGSRP